MRKQIVRPVSRDADPDADEGEERDRHVDEQQGLPRDDGEREAAGGRPDGEPDEPGRRDHGEGADAEVLACEEPERERHRAGCRHRGREPGGGTDGDEFGRGLHGRGGEARRGEERQPREHDPSASEAVCDGAEQEHGGAEDDRVGPGDPLQADGRGVEFAADGGQRDGEHGVVEHLEQEHRGQAGQASRSRAGAARSGRRTGMVDVGSADTGDSFVVAK
ncbi:hypothetical protein JOE58_000322 [Curtobacterium luteum]|uniref:Uncharacterized protein n=1 Tax=Curtobacterium luteum TaxID=33881 RepID=A0A8H9GBX3_9MICO|nr:hypothetical protein [Curtobacterium luteum]GGL05683.1 hypothetical protein GCM10009769_24850 [Curtobacterium luteum]